MSPTTVLLDCDGVLANFIEAANQRLNKKFNLHIKDTDWKEYDAFESFGLTRGEFWSAIDVYDFWCSEIEPYPWARDIIKWAKANFGVDNWFIATAPSANPDCFSAKAHWLANNLGVGVDRIIIGRAKFLMANPRHVLIDDFQKNVDAFRAKRGKAILFPQYWNEHKKISLEPAAYLSQELLLIRQGLQLVKLSSPGPSPVE
jgi:5'(3')-deoxyribonucleotidase